MEEGVLRNGRKSIETFSLALWTPLVRRDIICIKKTNSANFSIFFGSIFDSGEGTIEEDEFTAVNLRGDVTASECAEAFKHMSKV